MCTYELKDIYTDNSVTVHLHQEGEKITIKRGVRQGNTISPKLFTATSESIFRRLNWENKGVKIDGQFLSNLCFADDIFLCTETPQELQQMLQEPSDESRRMGLKMNIAKLMVVDNTPINVNNVLIENVQGSGTWDNTTASRKRTRTHRKITRTNRYNEESWQAGRHTPNTGISSKATFRLPDETCVQLMCAASYDIWSRDLVTDRTSTEQTCGRPDINGKKYAQYHMQR